MLQLLTERDRIVVKDADIPGVPDPDKDATYTLRPIAKEQQRAIETANTHWEVTNKRGQEKEPVLDVGALTDDLLDYALLSWTGIIYEGQPLPCVREHKLKLDNVRTMGLLRVARSNPIERAPEVHAASFREPAGVL